MYCTRVLACLAVLVGFAHSFSWDIVVGRGKRLEFYDNGTLTHAENLLSANEIMAITYDAVHNRVLFADRNKSNKSISSFDLTSRKTNPIVMKRIVCFITSLAYDPLTQLLFWTECNKIYSISLKPASSNKTIEGNLLVTLNYYCGDIAVDSCRGFIYWITEYEIERAAFDGSEREVLIEEKVFLRTNLAIELQTQKMFWIEYIRKNCMYPLYIESAELNGKNRTTLYSNSRSGASSMGISKDFIYWMSSNKKIMQLPKNEQHDVEPILYFSIPVLDKNFRHKKSSVAATNYTILDQTLRINTCEALKSLISNSSVSNSDVEEGYSSTCHNFCIHGSCSVSAEGHPKCSCNQGYSGERCEVNACHKHCLNDGVCSLNEAGKPVCQCTADYQGERCDVSICKDYCLQGNCSVSFEGQPTCRCNAGYSGERCEVNACHGYCINKGVCSLNEEDEPVCHCIEDYEGERCDVAASHTDVSVNITKPAQRSEASH